MPRPRKLSDTDLVAAAARAVGRHGPHDLTLAAVAEEAGVAPATLVQRFGSKRDLLLAVAAGGEASVEPVFARARARHRSPVKAIEEGLAAMAGFVGDPDTVANHLAFLALDLGDPEFRAHAAAHADAMRDGISALLREAQEAGEIAPGPRAALAEALQGAYNGALLLWSIDRRGTAPDRVRRHARLLLRSAAPSGA